MHGIAVGVVDFGALTGDDDPVAVFQIAHRIGEGRERNRIRSDEHLAVAETDRERRAAARADQKVILAGEQERESEGPAQPRQRHPHRLDRRGAAL